MSLDIRLVRQQEVLWEGNLTFNLCSMARAAGIYEALYHPYWVGCSEASHLVEHLTKGLSELESNAGKFNDYRVGWGTSADLISFVKEYLAACIGHPEAFVETQ